MSLIHILAFNKISAQVVVQELRVQDAQRNLALGLHGGVTEEEQEMVVRLEKKELEVFQYILESITKQETKWT